MYKCIINHQQAVTKHNKRASCGNVRHDAVTSSNNYFSTSSLYGLQPAVYFSRALNEGINDDLLE